MEIFNIPDVDGLINKNNISIGVKKANQVGGK